MNSVLNTFVDDDGKRLIVTERTSEGIRQRRIRARYVTYHRTESINRSLMRMLKKSDKVAEIAPDGPNGEWTRISWVSDRCRNQARWKFRDLNIETFEGDVDPVRWWLTETKTQIARPRRCYLDIEADSRISFAEKAKMRILCWAISDDTGPVARAVLSEDTDEAEKKLLEKLWLVLDQYDQVCAWYGGDPDDAESGFDFYVIAKRSQRCGLPIDTRRWLWLDQLVVWRRMNFAESGDEKESMRLEDIAQNQIKEGKEATPDWVIEKFGNKTLAALAWDLWAAGGKYRKLLLEYCVKDTELLRKLEVKKQFLTLFQTLCEVCSVFGNTRGLNPTAQMDGFLLRLADDADREAGLRLVSPLLDQFLGRRVDSLHLVWRPQLALRVGLLPELRNEAGLGAILPHPVGGLLLQLGQRHTLAPQQPAVDLVPERLLVDQDWFRKRVAAPELGVR